MGKPRCRREKTEPLSPGLRARKRGCGGWGPAVGHGSPLHRKGRPPDLLARTVVFPLHGLRQRLQQVLVAREGKVHLHAGVGAHPAGLWMESHRRWCPPNQNPHRVRHGLRAGPCQPVGSARQNRSGRPFPPAGRHGQKDGRSQHGRGHGGTGALVRPSPVGSKIGRFLKRLKRKITTGRS